MAARISFLFVTKDILPGDREAVQARLFVKPLRRMFHPPDFRVDLRAGRGILIVKLLIINLKTGHGRLLVIDLEVAAIAAADHGELPRAQPLLRHRHAALCKLFFTFLY
jgi:hypothetical protein